MKLAKGQIFWLNLKSRIPHPCVIIKIQDDTLTLCRITTNMKKASMPGNVLLETGESNLEKQSIIDVADVIEVKGDELGEFIGTLSEERVEEVISGINFLQKTYFNR